MKSIIKVFKKITNKNVVIILSLILILSITILLFIRPKIVKCTLKTNITNETVIATFKSRRLKYIDVTTTLSYESNKKAEEEIKLQEFGIRVIKNYGYKVTSKIEDGEIIIKYYGKVKNIENNIYTKNIKTKDFIKNMEEKNYICE